MRRARPRIVRKQGSPPGSEPLQPKLVLPQENSDEHPVMKKYAKISEQALKNSPPILDDDDSGEVFVARVG